MASARGLEMSTLVELTGFAMSASQAICVQLRRQSVQMGPVEPAILI